MARNFKSDQRMKIDDEYGDLTQKFANVTIDKGKSMSEHPSDETYRPADYGEDGSDFQGQKDNSHCHPMGAPNIAGVPQSALVSSSQQAPTFKDLNENDIHELAMYLDPDKGTSVKNWDHLAMEFGFNFTERDVIRQSYCGGGNPAYEFLLRLKSQRGATTFSDLIEKHKEMQRNDIVLFLEKNRSELSTTIGSISVDFLETLSKKLIQSQGAIKSWRNLAGLYGFSTLEINKIAALIKTPNEYSPTSTLFHLIQTRDPGFELYSLGRLFEKMQRNDVAIALLRIIERLSHKPSL